MIEHNSNTNNISVDQLLAKQSAKARKHMASAVKSKERKSRFDYLTISFAWLMALITVAGILVSLSR